MRKNFHPAKISIFTVYFLKIAFINTLLYGAALREGVNVAFRDDFFVVASPEPGLPTPIEQGGTYARSPIT